ncbi:uncharacterized protein L969DRAFT_355896 [Mixia osmundae IAM 14324]|uniref:RING-type E3 ubiquitin transferase n=1 Tax=Mixia osmundae (strain CBS 9802 / IAM 14324 / JCM 22182 / KY 12970) TaxID=764103 RepID=G7E5E2_MIXOS|nr:uncharacterized protein L969DRAFT_355896 [Mixia osmundae IAM 14324]KEI40797.1 hypothetical protein L969DRAFT_355896 [Mixia osmundae IAM 14324]GAA98052.1 hypothetical protein E5Q_04733 [Mixia osmundae IAM 14324]
MDPSDPLGSDEETIADTDTFPTTARPSAVQRSSTMASSQEDICRVCRAPSEPDDPLYQPCRCSGSIRHVHQGCLVEWLSHSHKDHCELCNTPFKFTSIYATDMPPATALPLRIIVSRAAVHLLYLALFIARAFVVLGIWLLAVPLITEWIWTLFWWCTLPASDHAGLDSTASSLTTVDYTRLRSGDDRSAYDLTLSCQGATDLPLIRFGGAALQLGLIRALKQPVAPATARYLERALPLRDDTVSNWVYERAASALRSERYPVLEAVHNVVQSAWPHFSFSDVSNTTGFTPYTGPLQKNHFLAPLATRYSQCAGLVYQVRLDPARSNDDGPLVPLEASKRIFRLPVPYSPWSSETGRAAPWQGELRIHDLQAWKVLRSIWTRHLSHADTPILAPSHRVMVSSKSLGWFKRQDFESIKPVLKRLGKEAFKGQIIAAAIVIAFILVFLLREWVMQNAPLPEPNEAIALAVPPLPTQDDAAWVDEETLDGEEIDDDAQQDWTDARPHTRLHRREPDALRGAAARPVRWVPAPPPPQPPRGIFQEQDDDDHPFVEADEDAEEDAFDGERFDELEGLLEAVGMRGSLIVLFQNAALIVLAMMFALSLTVWLPYLAGNMAWTFRSIPLQAVSAPIRAVKTLTDPVVRLVLKLSAKSWPLLSNSQTWQRHIVPLIRQHTLANDTSSDIKQSYYSLREALHSQSLVDPVIDAVCSPSVIGRLSCVALGHASIITLGLIAIFVLPSVTTRMLRQEVIKTITQALQLWKVTMFIIVELFVFPLLCGCLMNACSVPLIAGSTLTSRARMFLLAPCTATFLTWLAGTCLMYTFALWIDLCRVTFREGVLWFIKDPSDPAAHPIKDILTASTLTQIGKLIKSALLYAIVILLVIGCPVYALQAIGILPLRMDSALSMTSGPVDYLFVYALVPPTIKLCRPRSKVWRLFVAWCKLTAHQLRLSSFLFGKRRPDEEVSHARGDSWQRLWRTHAARPSTDTSSAPRPSGHLARVPASDIVKVVKGRKMVILVDEASQPLEPRNIAHVEAQNHDAGTANHFTVVYLPPQFYQRVFLFGYLLWLTGSIAFTTALVVPLLTGRLAGEILFGRQVHDAHALLLGIYLVLGVYGLATATARAVQSHRSTDLSPTALAHSLRRGLGVIYFGVVASFIMPVLMAICTRTILATVVARSSSGALVVEITLLRAWTEGAITLAFLWAYEERFGLKPFVPRHVRITAHNALYHDEGRGYVKTMLLLNENLIAPLFTSMLGMVAAPAIIASALAHLYPTHAQGITSSVYKLAGGLLSAHLVSRSMSKYAKMWLARIKDEVYLVDRRLRNFGDDSPDTEVSQTLFSRPALAATPVGPENLLPHDGQDPELFI